MPGRLGFGCWYMLLSRLHFILTLTWCISLIIIGIHQNEQTKTKGKSEGKKRKKRLSEHTNESFRHTHTNSSSIPTASTQPPLSTKSAIQGMNVQNELFLVPGSWNRNKYSRTTVPTTRKKAKHYAKYWAKILFALLLFSFQHFKDRKYIKLRQARVNQIFFISSLIILFFGWFVSFRFTIDKAMLVSIVGI